MSIETAVILAVIASIIGLAFAFYQRNFVLSQNAGNEKMQKIAGAIQKGAQAFLSREYRAVAVVVVLVTIVLVILSTIEGSGMSIWTAVAFVCGAVASGLSGYIGMYIAVRANVRTAQAASESLNKGLRVAFASGTVMSTMVVSLALLGVSLLFIIFTNQLGKCSSCCKCASRFRLWRHFNCDFCPRRRWDLHQSRRCRC